MSKNKIHIYIGLSFLLILLAFFIVSSSKNENELQNTLTNTIQSNTNNTVKTAKTIENAPGIEKQIEEKNIQDTYSFTLKTGDLDKNISFSSNTILYDALVQAKNTGTIYFNGKNYPGLGFFVTDIENLHGGNGQNLLYYINGKEASVGVSSYKLKDGDIIEWKLE